MVDFPTAIITARTFSSIGIKIQTFSANVAFSLVSRLVKNTLAFPYVISHLRFSPGSPSRFYRVPVGIYGWIKPMARPATATMNAANPTVCTHKAR